MTCWCEAQAFMANNAELSETIRQILTAR